MKDGHCTEKKCSVCLGMLKSSGHSTKKNAAFTENCECVQNSVSLFHLHCCKETNSDSIGFLTGGWCILEDTNSIPQAWQEFIMYMKAILCEK